MADIRVTHSVDPKHNHDCDRIHLDDYEMEEVLLPARPDRPHRNAIRVVIRGKNLRAVAQPLYVLVGGEPLQFLRIAPDERSVEGVLLATPRQGAFVDVHLGDQDAARHPRPVETAAIKRLGPL